MNFSPNKTPIEIIKEGAFGGTYFRDIYSGVHEKWYKNPWKEFVQLKDIDAKFYVSDYYDVNVNKYGVKCGTSLGFWENKGRINKIDLYGWFQCILVIGQADYRKMIKDKLIDGKKSVKMIRDGGSKFDDYSRWPKIRQVLLHLSYELTENDYFNELTN